MPADEPYNERNRKERERMRALIERLSDDDLRRSVNEHWTVAALLLHIGFWDARNRWLSDRIRVGIAFTPSDVEPDDPTWINDTTSPFLHAIPPRDAARLALRLAEEADAGVASLPPERTWPTDPTSLVNPVRAEHRAEHLDQIEAALGRKG
jgi:hypothetical protein